jgi:DNA repair exonuclease SbcCD ATPase subunit
LSSVQSELQRLQQRERSLESTVNSLLSIIEFNEELLSEDDLAGVEVDGDVAAELDPETQTVRCWTCGTSVERRAIDDRLDDLREVVDEKRRERNELRTDINELRSELRALRSTAQERESLESRIDDVEAEIDERTDRIERLEERQSELETRIEELEAKAAESDDLRDSDLLERYQRLSELEYERGQLEGRIESLESELESVREEADRLEAIEAELEDRESELASARNRIGDLEQSAVDTFNDHMETVLDLLAYENVARVWIERKNESAVDQTVAESSFELHVVRSTADGAVYEDRVGHLSESEREVIGLVVALAGYLVHDVHESVPVMLLDSLESIDADRIAALIDYFSDFVPYLVVALLPEDASALPDEHARIRMGEALA